MIKTKVFLAAPLFSEPERGFNSMIAKKLRESGFEVWLAQESPFIQEGTHEEKRRIYEGDISALKASEVVVAVLDGIGVEAGVAYEMGYAEALGKAMIGLKTDYRAFSRIEEINLMLEVPLVKICKSIDEVIDSLRKIR